jgi:hypothetical protein
MEAHRVVKRRSPHIFLDNQLTDGDEVSLTRRPPFTPRKIPSESLSSSMLSKKAKMKIYKGVILPVVLNGCETWSVILREENRLRVFENRLLSAMFGRKRKWHEDLENCIMRSFVIFTSRQLLPESQGR